MILSNMSGSSAYCGIKVVEDQQLSWLYWCGVFCVLVSHEVKSVPLSDDGWKNGKRQRKFLIYFKREMLSFALLHPWGKTSWVVMSWWLSSLPGVPWQTQNRLMLWDKQYKCKWLWSGGFQLSPGVDAVVSLRGPKLLSFSLTSVINNSQHTHMCIYVFITDRLSFPRDLDVTQVGGNGTFSQCFNPGPLVNSLRGQDLL